MLSRGGNVETGKKWVKGYKFAVGRRGKVGGLIFSFPMLRVELHVKTC